MKHLGSDEKIQLIAGLVRELQQTLCDARERYRQALSDMIEAELALNYYDVAQKIEGYPAREGVKEAEDV